MHLLNSRRYPQITVLSHEDYDIIENIQWCQRCCRRQWWCQCDGGNDAFNYIICDSPMWYTDNVTTGRYLFSSTFSRASWSSSVLQRPRYKQTVTKATDAYLERSCCCNTTSRQSRLHVYLLSSERRPLNFVARHSQPSVIKGSPVRRLVEGGEAVHCWLLGITTRLHRTLLTAQYIAGSVINGTGLARKWHKQDGW